MMRKAIFFLLLFLTNNLLAQPVNHTWTTSSGGIGITNDKLRIINDDVGNIYMIGEFSGTKDFGTFTLTATGSVDVFVAKYDNVGVCQWAVTCSGPQFTTNKAGGIAIDDNYNLYVTGTYSQSMTISTQTVNAIGGNEIFIAQLDNSGNCIWLKSAGANFQDQANDIVFDGNQHIYVTGAFEAFAYFDATTTVTSNASTVDIFLAKYDLAGALIWVKTAGGNDTDIANAVKVDNTGNPVITGYFFTTATFGTTNVTSVGFGDLFITKYDASGSVLWVTRAGGAGPDVGQCLSLDALNNVYVAGTHNDTSFFGTIQLNDNGYGNGFFTKLNAATGTIAYAKRIGSTNSEIIYDISAEAGGAIYLTGHFSGACTFGTLPNGNGTIPTLTTPSGTNVDAFVAKYNGAGSPVWAHKIGGANADLGKSLIALGAGKVLAAGNYSGTVIFGSTTLTSSGNLSIYLTELNGGTVGIFNPQQSNTISLFPNPANNFLNLTLPENGNGDYSISISDLVGKSHIVNEYKNNNQNLISIDISHLAQGVYQIKLISNNYLSTGKFIVE